MPFRVLGLDLMDLASLFSPGPEFARASFQKGAEMLKLKDPILTVLPPPDGIELPPLRGPETLGTSTSYVFSTSATATMSKELAEAGSAPLPAVPALVASVNVLSHIAGIGWHGGRWS